VAVARKLAVLVWQLLTHQQDYDFAKLSLVREKLRRLELLCGASPHPGSRAGGPPVFATNNRRLLESSSPPKSNSPTGGWRRTGRRGAGGMRARHGARTFGR
jgi:transposase